MRHRICLLLLPLFSCGGQEPSTVAATDKQEAGAPAVKAATTGIRYFQGTLNGKIPVTVWLRVIGPDSVMEGAVTYTGGKSKTPIRLLGNASTDGCFLRELLPDGEISGLWSGKLTEKGYSGTWTAPLGEKEFAFDLRLAATGPENLPGYAATGDITGSYEYRYPKDGGMGTLNVRRLGSDRIIYNIDANIGAPSYNMAVTGEDTLALQDHTAIHQSTNEFGSCGYRIRFFRDFAVIDYPDGAYECGFGHNASVEGMFIKTGNDYQRSPDEVN